MEDIEINKDIKNSREIIWQAPAFKYYPKDISWYWLSFIIAIVIIAFALWQKNFLFAIFIILAEIIVLIWAKRQPETIKFKIDDKGITIADKTYNYSNLEKFCLRPDRESENFEELIIKRKTYFDPYLKIMIDARISSRAREILSQKLTEEEYEDSLIDSVFKWLRF